MGLISESVRRSGTGAARAVAISLAMYMTLLPVASTAQTCSTSVIAGNVTVNVPGASSLYVAVSGDNTAGVKLEGSSIIMGQARAYLADSCDGAFAPTTFAKLYLLDKTLSYTVDISQVGCACNAALYLVKMPAYDSNNNPDPTKCQDYYCDANNVCGSWCPEIDVMESNQYAFAITPHSCDTPQGNYYPHCDGGGCGMNVYKLNPNNYGPDSSKTIDTSQPFNVSTSFVSSGGVLASMVTVLSQQGRSVTVTHDGSTCGGASYLASLTESLQAGMVLTLSLWGNSGSSMSWLDSPPCDVSVACVPASFTVSNIAVN